MTKQTIICKGAKLTDYTQLIENTFTDRGIRVEQINMDFILLCRKRYYPARILNEKINILHNRLRQDGRIQ